MSAFQVSTDHINAMALAANSMSASLHGLSYFWHSTRNIAGNEDHIGQMLTDENARSVAYRYNEAPVVETFSWRPFGRIPTPVETLKLLSCYEYQACETPDYKDTEAAAFCDALRHAAIASLPGYEDAPWEWSTSKRAA